MSSFETAVTSYINEHGSIDAETYKSLQEVFCEGKIINTAKNTVNAVTGTVANELKGGARFVKHALRAVIDTPDQSRLRKAQECINDAIGQLGKCKSIDMEGMMSKLDSLSNSINMILTNPKAKKG